MTINKSYVAASLSFEGDPFVFWRLLKEMKGTAEEKGIKIEFGEVTTITEQ